MQRFIVLLARLHQLPAAPNRMHTQFKIALLISLELFERGTRLKTRTINFGQGQLL
ncbi:MAG: hypothetical protein OFPII_07010 [Osedax symbiont Rs1]|nr:MAG: hypothetical protein OFPII_07010 [Osedax symbiont Rs1]